MEWWQILLIGIASLAAGLSLGSGVHFLLKWLAKRREMILTAKKQEMAESAIEEPVVEEPVVKEPAVAEKVIEEPVAAEPDKAAALELLEEIESNLEIANKPLAAKLLPFQTRVFEAIQDSVDRVPANIHDEVRQIYIDIRLANSIVRLATDFNRRSKSLDDSYKQLCISIAEKLSNIKPLIEKSK